MQTGDLEGVLYCVDHMNSHDNMGRNMMVAGLCLEGVNGNGKASR